MKVVQGAGVVVEQVQGDDVEDDKDDDRILMIMKIIHIKVILLIIMIIMMMTIPVMRNLKMYKNLHFVQTMSSMFLELK